LAILQGDDDTADTPTSESETSITDSDPVFQEADRYLKEKPLDREELRLLVMVARPRWGTPSSQILPAQL